MHIVHFLFELLIFAIITLAVGFRRASDVSGTSYIKLGFPKFFFGVRVYEHTSPKYWEIAFTLLGFVVSFYEIKGTDPDALFDLDDIADYEAEKLHISGFGFAREDFDTHELQTDEHVSKRAYRLLHVGASKHSTLGFVVEYRTFVTVA
jgi:hypothetical protein